MTDSPKIEDFGLDAYGHLSFVVGFSDESDEGDDPRDCGDWLACADFNRIGDFVAYHVVVNSDSGGFIDTMEQGILSVEDARKQLPGLLETWNDVASEHLVVDGDWFTDDEVNGNREAIERWREAVENVLGE